MFLSADLLLGKALAPVHVPGIEYQANSPAEDWKDRPEEAVQIGHRPDDYDESVDQAVDNQVHAEVAPFLEPLDRLFAQGGMLRHFAIRHGSHLLSLEARFRDARCAEPIVPPQAGVGRFQGSGRWPAMNAGNWPPPSTTRFAPLTYPASGEASSKHASAMSAGAAIRPSGTVAATAARAASSP